MSLGELIKQHSMKSARSLKMLELMEAEVTKDPPELEIKLKGSDRLIIPKELIVVAEHLCEVKQKVNLNAGSKTEIGKQSFDMTITQMPHPLPPPNNTPHDHPSKLEVALADRSFDMQEGEVHYINDDKKDDLLKKGDKVMVMTFEGGQKFFIIDRIVQY
ncbi:Protein of unknown function [Paenibacillus catalpae]|uniref:DUF2577 domain-containing protein n=1 Tax=Paenibacillus catalpae TaxID=1045775 RepID=A0A1I2BEX4_9BACL|nr:DUF2577 family protein [Paenibacillus catalpae]SFE54721.1 Protein of unknown function [Paenibacillus catalpae]